MRCVNRRSGMPGIFIFFVLAMIFWSGFSWWMLFFILPFAFRFMGHGFGDYDDHDAYDDDFPDSKRKNDEKPKRYIDTVDGDRLEII